MAATKLTLHIEAETIEKAKRYSREHNTSLSRLVARYLEVLSSEGGDVYSPVIRRLWGIVPPDTTVDDYHDHLRRKYGVQDDA